MEPMIFEYTKYEDSDDYRTCDRCGSFAPVAKVPTQETEYSCEICFDDSEKPMSRMIAQIANALIDEITQRQQKAGVENASF
jgi:hypothetical protein